MVFQVYCRAGEGMSYRKKFTIFIFVEKISYLDTFNWWRDEVGVPYEKCKEHTDSDIYGRVVL